MRRSALFLLGGLGLACQTIPAPNPTPTADAGSLIIQNPFSVWDIVFIDGEVPTFQMQIQNRRVALIDAADAVVAGGEITEAFGILETSFQAETTVIGDPAPGASIVFSILAERQPDGTYRAALTVLGSAVYPQGKSFRVALTPACLNEVDCAPLGFGPIL